MSTQPMEGVMSTDTGWNPRYVEYARAHGATAEDLAARERTMTGFILWINARWREWEALTRRREPHSAADHATFDAWLARWLAR